MFFKNSIENIKSRKIKIFVDMDGVIADYVIGLAKDYDKKRPLTSNIKQLEEVSKMSNVELYILSVSRMNEGVAQKNTWLDINAPFFKKENRVIISRELNKFKKSVDLKCDFVKSIDREEDCTIIIIDDDCQILKELQSQNDDIILYKDTVFID